MEDGFCLLKRRFLERKHLNKPVAEELQNTLLEIRSESPDPTLWVPFIYFGA